MDTQKLSPAEFKQATKFDSTDFGWIIMSIGMAIGQASSFYRYK
ncbi:Inner membrane transport protein YhaO [Mannheimia haemolytica]|uniref:Inner membrane transport protein YhaO n=1 Tax=Mannheimia haemolytica TaxID=75985 RepID=A0A378MWV1_MANHA|nr:Inner membrane transport protein YhaO [Mannheimia haemolytica]